MSITKPQPTGSHPLAGQSMSGADMVVQVLADEGVDTIFGYSGGAILPTYDAIFRFNGEQANAGNGDKIKLIVPANEQGAGFMAAGYARSTGKVGVFLVTSGPGATNCVTPIRDCAADSIPVVLICGQVPTAAIGSDAFQEAPVFNIMSACAKHTFLVKDPAKLEETVRAAFEIARSGRPGPVVIDLPKDVQNWSGKFKGEGVLQFRGYELRQSKLDATEMSDARAAKFFEMLGDSKTPLIYAGGGVICSDGADELRAFAKEFQIPVVTTLMGIGSFDITDPLSLHMLGMHGTAYANYAVEDCDMVIAVGSRFDDRVAGKVKDFAPKAKYIAHLDIDAAEIGKVKSIDWSFVADAAKGLNSLTEYGKKIGFSMDNSAWLAHINKLKTDYKLDYERENGLIQPQEVVALLGELTDGDAIITTGVGQHQMWAAQYFKFRHPRTWITSGSMGTMGFGLPAAIGASFANPDKLVIDIDGDGSLRMNLGEMETVTTYGLNTKILLLNNEGDGMVRQWQRTFFGNRFSGTDKSLHLKDWQKAAEADGYKFVHRTNELSKLREDLQAFIDFDGPAFLEVMIDREASVFPMVGPGMNYKQMDTGPYINSRGEKVVEEKSELPKPDLF